MKTAKKLKNRSRVRGSLGVPLPKFWQPNITNAQKLDCKLIHWDLIDRFTSNRADRADLWDWMETGFTYSQLMRLLAAEGIEFSQESVSAINDQLNIYEKISTHYASTRRIELSAPELLIARTAALVFDELIELDRNGCAVRAALWSKNQMEKIMKI